MVHIFLLFSKELGTDRVKSITSKLVLPLHVLQDINLDPAVQRGIFRIPLSERFRGEMRILGLSLLV